MVGTAVDGFVEYGLPWMGRKAVEMGRYGASEALRNKKLQRKAVNYGINNLTPLIQDSVGTAMDQLSTKVRPKRNTKLIGRIWMEKESPQWMWSKKRQILQ